MIRRIHVPAHLIFVLALLLLPACIPQTPIYVYVTPTQPDATEVPTLAALPTNTEIPTESPTELPANVPTFTDLPGAGRWAELHTAANVYTASAADRNDDRDGHDGTLADTAARQCHDGSCWPTTDRFAESRRQPDGGTASFAVG